MNKIKTCEFVSPKHPDKICDQIADLIIDAYFEKDSKSRVAVEVMGGHGHITISGEITSSAKIDIEKLVKEFIGYDYKINIYATEQSPQIAQGVDIGGAGDQGIMMGYAVRETTNFMPIEYELARDLCKKVYAVYPFDGKTQVTIEGDKIKTVVCSFQNTKTIDLEELVRENIKASEYLINPAGEWTIGGFDADSGISGRKIVIDNYGPEFGVGGGSFSGKDYTKVDRSGAYMARRIAVDYLKKLNAEKVSVKLAYAIGKKDPVMAVANIDGKEMEILEYDLSPLGIYNFLQMSKIKWIDTASWGHFGREFPWK